MVRRILSFEKLTREHFRLSEVKRTLDNLGTKYMALELNKAEDGDMLMDVVSAVTGNRAVSTVKKRLYVNFTKEKLILSLPVSKPASAYVMHNC